MDAIVGKGNRSYWMGIAILLVVLFHIYLFNDWNGYDKDVIDFFFHYGYVGVDIFLYLSAYGLCCSFENNSLLKFYKNRVHRLFPMYFIYLFILLSFFIKDNPLKIAVAQTTGMATFMGMWVEWYVPALIVLYILFPLLYMMLKRISKTSINKQLTCLIILLAIISYPFLSYYIHADFVRRFPIILGGIYLYLYSSNKRLLLLLYTYMAAIMLIKPNWGDFLYLPLLFMAVDKLKMKFPFKRSISFLGKHSLELYLGQSIGLQYFYSSVNDNVRLNCILGVGMSLLFAVLFWGGHELFWRIIDILKTKIIKSKLNVL